MCDHNLDKTILDLIDDHDLGGQDEENRIYLTQNAANKIKQIIKKEGLSSNNVCLRIQAKAGGCAGMTYKIGLDYQSENDIVLTSRNVLIVIDQQEIKYVNGITIDHPSGLDSRGFLFINPKAKETCGCGTSFSV